MRSEWEVAKQKRSQVKAVVIYLIGWSVGFPDESAVISAGCPLTRHPMG
jgi:hypothetical protein